MTWEFLLFAQALVTALSSAGNSVYFWRYRSPSPARRVGAAILTLVSLATLVESIYLGLLAVQSDSQHMQPFGAIPLLLAARSLACLGSLSVSLLILRGRWSR